MHQGRGLERLPRFLMGQLGRRQLAEFFVNQRQELLGGGRIARFNLRQDLGDVGHGTILKCHARSCKSASGE